MAASFRLAGLRGRCHMGAGRLRLVTDDDLDLQRLAAAVAQCTTEFNAALPGRVAAIRAALAGVRSAGPDGLDELVDQLHRLAGSAGTFGQPALGARARQLELACSKAAADGVAAVLDQVAVFLDDLEGAVGRTGST